MNVCWVLLNSFPAAIEMVYDFFLIWFVNVVNSLIDFLKKLNLACIIEIIINTAWTRCIIPFYIVLGSTSWYLEFLCHCSWMRFTCNFSSSYFVLWLLWDGKSGEVTRGEAQGNKKVYYTQALETESHNTVSLGAPSQRLQGGQKTGGPVRLGHSLHWGFCGKGKAGQGERFRTG